MYQVVLLMALGNSPATPTAHRDIGYHHSGWAVRSEAQRHRRGGGGCNGCSGGYGGCGGGYGCGGGRRSYYGSSGCYGSYGCSGSYGSSGCYGSYGCSGSSGYYSAPANGSGYYDEGGRYYRLPAPREERREMKEQRDDRRKDRRSSEEESSPNEASPEAIPAPSDSADPVGVSRVVPRERMGLLARFRAGRR
ncbi:MAG TPA: hypothetical protein VKI65_17205 [Gemmataceae bacterium]|nr:hypothetical protein [Gemmataceae bacterium]